VTKPLRARELLATLEAHHVDYIVIGGLAAVLHGSTLSTGDADICPESSADNLNRLADALRELNARIRVEGEPDGLEFSFDPASLARMAMLNLTTDFGDFDISFAPAGFSGYDELVQHAVEVPVGGASVKVASLADVIRSKKTADRPKDRLALPILYALQDEIAKQESKGD
jgi:hypothetical protein